MRVLRSIFVTPPILFYIFGEVGGVIPAFVSPFLMIVMYQIQKS